MKDYSKLFEARQFKTIFKDVYDGWGTQQLYEHKILVWLLIIKSKSTCIVFTGGRNYEKRVICYDQLATFKSYKKAEKYVLCIGKLLDCYVHVLDVNMPIGYNNGYYKTIYKIDRFEG